MTPQPFDVLIPVAPKDIVKLPFVLDGVIEHVKGHEKVHCVFAEEVKASDVHDVANEYDIVVHTERDVFDFDKSLIRHRPCWQYQQYLKLFQNITANPWYLTLDCDIVILSDLNMWENGRPVWHVGGNQNHPQYFDFQEKMLGFGKVSPFSWIADMNFFNKGIILEMLCRFGYTIETFMQRAVDITTDNCYMGEPEFYGSYVDKYHHDMYALKPLKVIDGGARHQAFKTESIFSAKDIDALIKRHSIGGQYDVMPIHSWFTEAV